MGVLWDPRGPFFIKIYESLRSLDLCGFLVLEHENHALVLAVQPVDVFQVTIRGLWVNQPDELVGSRLTKVTRMFREDCGAYRNKDGVENHPDKVKSPAKTSNAQRRYLDNNIV